MNTKNILIVVLLLALVASLTALFTKSAKTEIVYQDRIIEKEVPVEVPAETQSLKEKEDMEEVQESTNSGLPEFATVPRDLMTVHVPKLNAQNTVVFESVSAPKSPAVLNSTYMKLFDLNTVADSPYNGTYYKSVSISNGVARLDLTGSWRPRGDLSGLYFRQLIEAAAFQFDSVDSIVVYLNGEVFDWCVDDESDGESGCPAQAKLWISAK